MKKDLLTEFNRYLIEKKLCTAKQRILVGVSGGIDSIVLASLFVASGYRIAIAHVNFGLRGKESDEDEAFVKQFAVTNNLPFFSEKFETKRWATDSKISIQMAARDLRYAWFEEQRKKQGYHFIAVAHHLQDLTETILINLLRGTGLAGMHGILPKQGKLIRPLLFAEKEEINLYAKAKKLIWREDSSNQKDDYTRNLIRHHVLPVFKKINPSYQKTFGENAGKFHQNELLVEDYIAHLTPVLLKKINSTEFTLPKTFFTAHPAGSTILFELLKPFQFSPALVDDIIKAAPKQAGKIFYSEKYQLVSDRDFFIISPNAQVSDDVVFKQHEDCLEISREKFNLFIYPLKMNKKLYAEILKNKNKNIAFADAAKVIFPVTVRSWNPGDYFIPLGMKGKKKISDFYTDLKLSLSKKEQTWILTDSEKITWIMGHRLDNRVAISPQTKLCYRFEFISAD